MARKPKAKHLTEDLSILLEPDEKEWIKGQKGGQGKYIRTLIRRDMQKFSGDEEKVDLHADLLKIQKSFDDLKQRIDRANPAGG